MGIIRVQVPKAPPPLDKVILQGGSVRRWWWWCEECSKGQLKLYSESDRDLAVRQHRFARHPEYFQKNRK